MQQDLKIKEQKISKSLPREAVETLDVLNELKSFTSGLRDKLMSEIKPSKNTIRLKLDEI